MKKRLAIATTALFLSCSPDQGVVNPPIPTDTTKTDTTKTDTTKTASWYRGIVLTELPSYGHEGISGAIRTIVQDGGVSWEYDRRGRCTKLVNSGTYIYSYNTDSLLPITTTLAGEVLGTNTITMNNGFPQKITSYTGWYQTFSVDSSGGKVVVTATDSNGDIRRSYFSKAGKPDSVTTSEGTTIYNGHGWVRGSTRWLTDSAGRFVRLETSGTVIQENYYSDFDMYGNPKLTILKYTSSADTIRTAYTYW